MSEGDQMPIASSSMAIFGYVQVPSARAEKLLDMTEAVTGSTRNGERVVKRGSDEGLRGVGGAGEVEKIRL